MLKETFNALQPTFNSQFRGAQAASLFASRQPAETLLAI
jgi:hypothetical protein